LPALITRVFALLEKPLLAGQTPDVLFLTGFKAPSELSNGVYGDFLQKTPIFFKNLFDNPIVSYENLI